MRGHSLKSDIPNLIMKSIDPLIQIQKEIKNLPQNVIHDNRINLLQSRVSAVSNALIALFNKSKSEADFAITPLYSNPPPSSTRSDLDRNVMLLQFVLEDILAFFKRFLAIDVALAHRVINYGTDIDYFNQLNARLAYFSAAIGLELNYSSVFNPEDDEKHFINDARFAKLKVDELFEVLKLERSNFYDLIAQVTRMIRAQETDFVLYFSNLKFMNSLIINSLDLIYIKVLGSGGFGVVW